MENQKPHPADLADQLQRVPLAEAQTALRALSKEDAAAVLHEWNEQGRSALLEGFSSHEVSEMVRQLPHNEAADVVAQLPTPQQEQVLAGLSDEQEAKVTTLLQYPPDTAGGIMSNQFLTLHPEQTVEECLRILRGRAEQAPDAISYLYVTNEAGSLVGIVSLRDLVFRRHDRRISEIMTREVKHIWVDDDQEKIAQLFEHYHYLALPVLERDGRMAGIVTSKQVINVLRNEATEDMQLMVGLSGEERLLTPWRKSIRKRLPWLCINLFTAFLAGAVVAFFEDTIAKWTALAVFLPIIAGQGGNAGIQTLTVIIREMALGELTKGDGYKALFKETTLGFLNGIAIGILVGVAGYFWKGNAILGVVAGVAMVLNMIVAALSGVLVPYGLKWMKIDPALASGIFVTTVTDVAGFLFYLSLAALAFKWLV